MKKSVVFVVGLLACAQAFSQTIIKGKVVDAEAGEPEVGAVVRVFEGAAADDRGIGYTMSDTLGFFKVSVKLTGTGTVQIMNMGRKTVERGISGQAGEVDLGVIAMEDDVQNLSSSTVTALKTLVRIDADKLTYDIEGDTDSKTMTILEMLRKVPMVTVDAQDNITVNGSSSFKVYVDGRPNQMLTANASQMFKLMPANNIKSIEVITNPGAKYDAEGTGGILDIKTKTGSDKQVVSDGVYGTVTGEVNTRGGLDGGVNLNAQKGKWTFGTNVNVGTDPFYGVQLESYQKDKSTGLANITKYTGDADQRYIWGSMNVSYEIDSLNLVTASAGLDRFYNKSFMNDGNVFTLNASGDTLSTIGLGGDGESAWNGIEASVDYQHRFAGKPNKYLTFSYQFSGSPSVSESNMMYSGVDSVHSITNDISLEHTFQADYTTPLWNDNHSLSTGLKYIFRDNKADDVENPGTSEESPSIYDYRNNIGALYAEYTGVFGQLVGKAGLRYEHTWVGVDYKSNPAQNFKLNYPALVPNFSLQYNVGMAQNISFSYNMRIHRPGIYYLNPYVQNTGLYAISYGNSSLDAEQSHRFQLAYNMASPKWVLSLRLMETFGDKGIGEYSFYDEKGILNSTYGNVERSSRTAMNIYVNWNASTKTRIYVHGNGGYEYYQNIQDGLENGGWSVNGGLGFQHTFPLDIRVSGNIFANSRGYSLQGYRSGMSFGSVGITKSFLDDRLSFSLSGQSNLGLGRLVFHSYSESAGFISESYQRIPLRAASFSISYTFGKQQGIHLKQTARSITNDDLVGQSGGGSISGQVSSGTGM